MTTAPATEYLYAIDHCRGSLDCFTAYLDHPATPEEHWAGHLLRFRITRKTAKRIYYVQTENPVQPRIGYVDRQTIEADGDITRGRYGEPDHHLYLAEPPMPEWWTPKPKDGPATGELADLNPEMLRAIEALRELDWTGFDPTNLDDLVTVAGAVLNESDASLATRLDFADVLPPSED